MFNDSSVEGRGGWWLRTFPSDLPNERDLSTSRHALDVPMAMRMRTGSNQVTLVFRRWCGVCVRGTRGFPFHKVLATFGALFGVFVQGLENFFALCRANGYSDRTLTTTPWSGVLWFSGGLRRGFGRKGATRLLYLKR